LPFEIELTVSLSPEMPDVVVPVKARPARLLRADLGGVSEQHGRCKCP